METRLLAVDIKEGQHKGIAEGAKLLREGQLVAFPTETVYGLGANALNVQACQEIYRVKGRPQDNPLIVHIAALDMADKLVCRWSEAGRRCAEILWPGPLTLVLPKSRVIPDQITGGLGTVAIRMPSHPVAAALIKEAGVPVAAPSANLSGKPSPTTAQHVWQDLEGRIPMILDGGPCQVGLESTVLDVSGEIPVILRPGRITKEQLEALLGPVEIAQMGDSKDKPRSPGMKYRHYAPQGQMKLLTGGRENILSRMEKEILQAHQTGQRVGVLCLEESVAQVKEYTPDFMFILGKESTMETVGARLFEGLRLCDEQEINLVLAEGMAEQGLGAAIMNRMVKAAGGQLIHL